MESYPYIYIYRERHPQELMDGQRLSNFQALVKWWGPIDETHQRRNTSL